MPQGDAPGFSLAGWRIPDEGWADCGGVLSEVDMGERKGWAVFAPDWGLSWLLPPGVTAQDTVYVQDLRWEHAVARAL